MPSGLGGPRPQAAPTTLYLGTVERVTGATALVIVPELGGPTYSYGPARYPDGLVLAAGDPVVVGLLANRTGTRDSVVILTRLA